VARATFAQDHGDVKGEILELKNTNQQTIGWISSRLRSEGVTRVAREVGTKAGSAARLKSRRRGTWKDAHRHRERDGATSPSRLRRHRQGW